MVHSSLLSQGARCSLPKHSPDLAVARTWEWLKPGARSSLWVSHGAAAAPAFGPSCAFPRTLAGNKVRNGAAGTQCLGWRHHGLWFKQQCQPVPCDNFQISFSINFLKPGSVICTAVVHALWHSHRVPTATEHEASIVAGSRDSEPPCPCRELQGSWSQLPAPWPWVRALF